jgi:hypothetical protein
VLGGFLIFPSTQLVLRSMGHAYALPKGHPMNALGFQVAFTRALRCAAKRRIAQRLGNSVALFTKTGDLSKFNPSNALALRTWSKCDIAGSSISKSKALVLSTVPAMTICTKIWLNSRLSVRSHRRFPWAVPKGCSTPSP